jgi:hypothetical protein
MGEDSFLVGPAFAWGTPIAVTLSDTANNLKMDDVTAGFLVNTNTTTTAICAIVLTSSPVVLTVPIAPGGYIQLSPHSVRVKSTGTTLGSSTDLVAYF